jgi:hypothetical protein
MTFMTHMTRDPGAAAWQTPDSVAVTLPLGHPLAPTITRSELS